MSTNKHARNGTTSIINEMGNQLSRLPYQIVWGGGFNYESLLTT
jgi:hypothetical protein